MSSRSPLLCVVIAASLNAGATCGAKTVDELPVVETRTDEVLAPGDEVEVIIFGEPELSGRQRVRSTGVVRLPLVGPVPAAGLSADELAIRIQDAYNERYLTNAEVTVTIVASTSNSVYVLGSVARPGPYVVNGRMTLIDVLARAGGTTKLADDSRVQLTRKKDKQQVLVIVNAGEIRRGNAQDVELIPGDVLYVPESPL